MGSRTDSMCEEEREIREEGGELTGEGDLVPMFSDAGQLVLAEGEGRPSLSSTDR